MQHAHSSDTMNADTRSILDAILAQPGIKPQLDRLSETQLRRLMARIDSAPLFAHSYTFVHHFSDGSMGPSDLLEFASMNGLSGIKIHIDDGAHKSLASLDTSERRRFSDRARALGLAVDLEISSTRFEDFSRALSIAADVEPRSIRCYPRYPGLVSEILPKVDEDLAAFRKMAGEESQLLLLVEQHEDLKSDEMVQIVARANHPRIRLLFDFANMVNAFETPQDALIAQAPWISDVHLKDARILPDRGGWAQLGCKTGTGDIPLAKFLAVLLLLGENEPQVGALALEEEVDMFAPAYRFPDEPVDAFIPARDPSTTQISPAIPQAIVLENERRYAGEQVTTIRALLQELRKQCAAILAGAVAKN